MDKKEGETSMNPEDSQKVLSQIKQQKKSNQTQIKRFEEHFRDKEIISKATPEEIYNEFLTVYKHVLTLWDIVLDLQYFMIIPNE
jgi:hypothetical protein